MCSLAADPTGPPPYRSGAAGGAGADHAGQRGESPRRCVSPGSLHADRRTRWIVASSQMARASRSGHLTPVSSGGYCVWGGAVDRGPWAVSLGRRCFHLTAAGCAGRVICRSLLKENQYRFAFILFLLKNHLNISWIS